MDNFSAERGGTGEGSAMSGSMNRQGAANRSIGGGRHESSRLTKAGKE